MEKLSELSFRQLDKAFLFISLEDVSFLGDYFADASIANGLVAYAYIDHAKGISLEIICCAAFTAESKSLKLYATNEKVSINMAYENFVDAEVLLLSKEILPMDALQKKISQADARAEVSEQVLQTRNITSIDHCRILGKPDEVLVHLVNGNDNFETVHVRLEEVGKMHLVGTLLQDPKLDVPVHAGDRINFFIVKNAQGIMCIATF